MKITFHEWPSGKVNVGQPILLGDIEADDIGFVGLTRDGDQICRVKTKAATHILKGIESIREYVIKNRQ